MMPIEQVTEFFGWAALLNTLVLVLTTLALLGFRESLRTLHQRMFGVEKERILALYFNYLGQFKIITVTFFIVPYIALKLMQ